MNILFPISTPQTLVFIPRDNKANILLVITDESTSVETEFTLSTTYNNGYMSVSLSYDFEEGGSYTYESFDLEGNLLYRGKIFSTAQTDLENYNINQDLLQA